MQLDDIKKSPLEMTEEELLEQILGVRKARRNYSRDTKKAAVKKSKEDNVNWDEVQQLLDGLED